MPTRATLGEVRPGPLNPPRRLLMGSGPSNAEPRVLQAMVGASLAADDPALWTLLEDVSALLRGVFQTRNAAALAIGGASRAGLEAAIASLVAPDYRGLVGVYGHFGERLCAPARQPRAVRE